MLDEGEEPSIDDLSQDITEFPFSLNIINPNKGSYYAPKCRNCGDKNCRNCPISVSKTKTLRDLLDHMAHKTKFNDNTNLFLNLEQFRDLDNSSDDENKNSSNSWNKFKNNV